MEPVGVAIGALGLVGLFSACVDGFQLVETGKYLGKDFDLLETKFSNQRLRLKAWGQACGLLDTQGCGYDTRLNDTELRMNVERTLNHIIITLRNEELLANKYGLKECHPIARRSYGAHRAVIPINRFPLNTIWRTKFQDFKHRIDRTQNKAPLTAKARWAIGDKKKFIDLVQDLKDLIDDLEVLTAFAGFLDITKRQREIIRQKVARMTDVDVLAAMEEAREGNFDAISDAASFRLSQLHQKLLLEEEGSIVNKDATHDVDERRVPSPELQGWSVLPTEFEDHEPQQETKHQCLYRVKCHENDSVRIFFDLPTTDTTVVDQSEWTFLHGTRPFHERESRHLRGKRLLYNLEGYLEQNATLSFIIFHEYQCCKEDDQGMSCLPTRHSLRLLSQDLCYTLKSLSENNVEPSLLPEYTLESELQAPFLWLYHSRTKFQALKEHPEAISHDCLRLLLDCIGDCMAEEYALVDRLLSEGCISIQYLEYIFYPGIILLECKTPEREGCDYSSAYRQASSLEITNTDPSRLTLEIQMEVESLLYDGEFLCMTGSHAYVIPLKDKLKMDDLPLYPLQYAKDGIYDALFKRGRLFLECKSLKYVCRNFDIAGSESNSIFDRRVMIDVPALCKMNLLSIPSKVQQPCKVRRTCFQDWANFKDFLVLLPSTYTGLNLYTQRMETLHVSVIQPIVWMQTPLDNLEIRADLKQLLARIVIDATTPVPESTLRRDDPLLLNSDNRGSKVLLHGPSGTGKNYIIDGLVEYAKRPLCRVNLCDIATTPTELTKSLEKFEGFQRAWGCVIHLTAIDWFIGRVASADDENPLQRCLVTFMEKFDGMLFVSADSIQFLGSRLSQTLDLQISAEQIALSRRREVWYGKLRSAGLIGRDIPFDDDSKRLREAIPSLVLFRLTDRQIHKAIENAQRLAVARGRQYPEPAIMIEVVTEMSTSKRIDQKSSP